MQRLGEGIMGDYGARDVRTSEMHAHHSFPCKGWEKKKNISPLSSAWFFFLFGASFRSFVWGVKCSWAGKFAETWQPWLMMLAQNQLSKGTSKTTPNDRDCMLDEWMLLTLKCLLWNYFIAKSMVTSCCWGQYYNK